MVVARGSLCKIKFQFVFKKMNELSYREHAKKIIIWYSEWNLNISNINFQRRKFSHKVGNTVNSASRIQSNWLHLFLCEDLLGSRSTLYMTTTLLQDMKTPVAAKIDATALLYYCIEVCIKNDIFSSSWVVNSMQNYFFSCWRWLKFRRKKTYY